MRAHSAADDTRRDRFGSKIVARVTFCRYVHVPLLDTVQPDCAAIAKAKRNPAVRPTARREEVLFIWRFMADVLSPCVISFTPKGCASPPIIGLRRQVGVKAASQPSPSGSVSSSGRRSAGASYCGDGARHSATGKTLTWREVHRSARAVQRDGATGVGVGTSLGTNARRQVQPDGARCKRPRRFCPKTLADTTRCS